MANESKPGYKGKVTIGANNVLGMGVWSWNGFNRDLLEDTEFADTSDDYLYGLLRCGTVSFNGNYKKDDTQGQDMLRSAMINGATITDIRFYVDSASYYTPNSTTAAGGGLLAGQAVGHVVVQSVDVDVDKSALGTIAFSVQICRAPMRLI
ncbi:MAG: hypothetical protein GY841_12450 [FCB group bacterium]|nr:hypothetical protein [FCB group bacterium]